ncbi:MAG: hypothetical protein ABSF84_17080 [Acidimicrobiales bacterium]|jgi:hypothetical protein
MHPSQLEQLVKDRQTELLAARGSRRPAGRRQGTLVHLAHRGLQKTGIGLVRIGLRLAGPEPLSHGSQALGAGVLESPS